MTITNSSKTFWRPVRAALLSSAFALSAYSGLTAAVEMKLTLAGSHEVPAVKSEGAGTGMITVGDDGAISGSINTTGIKGTAAHIHEGAGGKNGPVALALTKDGDTYSVPKGSKLSAEQMTSFKAGHLYINVHSAANPNGELRAQLKN